MSLETGAGLYHDLVSMIGWSLYSSEVAVVLHAIVREKLIREDELSQYLHLHDKQVRQSLDVLSKQGLATRWNSTRVVDGKTISTPCWFVDYGKAVDVIQLKLYKMEQNLRKATESSSSQQFACTGCSKEFSVLDVQSLYDSRQRTLICDRCRSRLKTIEVFSDGSAEGRLKRFSEQFGQIQEKLRIALRYKVPVYHQFNEIGAVNLGTHLGTGQRGSREERPVSGPQYGMIGQQLHFAVEIDDSGTPGKMDAAEETRTTVVPPWMRTSTQMTSEASQLGRTGDAQGIVPTLGGPEHGRSSTSSQRAEKPSASLTEEELYREYVKQYREEVRLKKEKKEEKERQPASEDMSAVSSDEALLESATPLLTARTSTSTAVSSGSQSVTLTPSLVKAEKIRYQVPDLSETKPSRSESRPVSAPMSVDDQDAPIETNDLLSDSENDEGDIICFVAGEPKSLSEIVENESMQEKMSKEEYEAFYAQFAQLAQRMA